MHNRCLLLSRCNASNAFRGQAVEVETWYQQEGRLAARRDWVVRDGTTKEVLGGATR